MPLSTDQIVRWYVCPLVELPPGSGRIVVPPAIRNVLQGRWTTYGLPGMKWCIARIRGSREQHDILPPEISRWPVRKGGKLWSEETKIPKTITDVFTEVGFTTDGNKTPDEVLDEFCRWQKLQSNSGIDTAKWTREVEKRPDEDGLSVVEEV